MSSKVKKQDVIDAIKTIFDPELPVNIYELGLIYDIAIDDDNNVFITMTLTTPQCPVAESLPIDVEITVRDIKNVNNVDVIITFDPPWDEKMLSKSAKIELGLL